jgi:hypothetical protein
MLRFVMGSYGYAPVAGGLPGADDPLERTRAGLKFSGAKYFDTSAIYARTTSDPDYAIKVLDSKKYDLLIDAMRRIKDIAHNSVVTQ